VALPFINYAPNRLLSGEGAGFGRSRRGCRRAGCGALLLILLCWLPGRRPLLLSLLLLMRCWRCCSGAGQAAVQLAHSGSPLARTSPGSGLWLALALCCCWPASHPSSDHPGALALAAQCANLVDSLRAARQRSAESARC
jgi:hypothetical protein